MKLNIVSQEKIVGERNIPVRRLYNKLYGGGKTAKKKGEEKRRVTFDRVTTTPTRVSFKKKFVYDDKTKKSDGEKIFNGLKQLEESYNNNRKKSIYDRMRREKRKLRNLGHYASRHEIFLESFRHQSSYVNRWLSPVNQLQTDATGCKGRLMYNFDDGVYECNTTATPKEYYDNGLRFLTDIMFPGILRRFAMSEEDVAMFRTIKPPDDKETTEEYRYRQYRILLYNAKKEQGLDDGMYEVDGEWYGVRLDEKTEQKRTILEVLNRFYEKKYWIAKMNEYHMIITGLY